MASPQKENGYTAIANEILEKVMATPFIATHLKIILVCWRYSYGFNKKDAALSESFIANATGISKRYISSELKTLFDCNVLKIIKEASYTSSRVIAFNKNYDEWEYGTIVPQVNQNSTVESEHSTTVEPQFSTTDELQFHQKRQYKDNIKDIYILIFNYWNSKKIIVHRKLTDKLKQRIKTTLEDYTKEEVYKAIDNYSDIINDDKYYFSYKWTLKDFLQRGLEKFLDDSCHSNYLKQEYKEKKQLEGIKPNPEYLRMKEMLNNGNS